MQYTCFCFVILYFHSSSHLECCRAFGSCKGAMRASHFHAQQLPCVVHHAWSAAGGEVAASNTLQVSPVLCNSSGSSCMWLLHVCIVAVMFRVAPHSAVHVLPACLIAGSLTSQVMNWQAAAAAVMVSTADTAQTAPAVTATQRPSK